EVSPFTLSKLLSTVRPRTGNHRPCRLDRDGPRQELLTIDAQSKSRIFHVTASSGNFCIAGMTILRGKFHGIRSASADELSISDVLVANTNGLRTTLATTMGESTSRETSRLSTVWWKATRQFRRQAAFQRDGPAEFFR